MNFEKNQVYKHQKLINIPEGLYDEIKRDSKNKRISINKNIINTLENYFKGADNESNND